MFTSVSYVEFIETTQKSCRRWVRHKVIQFLEEVCSESVDIDYGGITGSSFLTFTQGNVFSVEAQVFWNQQECRGIMLSTSSFL
jgi:hypothetical protein